MKPSPLARYKQQSRSHTARLQADLAAARELAINETRRADSAEYRERQTGAERERWKDRALAPEAAMKSAGLVK